LLFLEWILTFFHFPFCFIHETGLNLSTLHPLISQLLGHSLHSLKSSSYFSPMTFQADIFEWLSQTFYVNDDKTRTKLYIERSSKCLNSECFPEDIEDRWTNISSLELLISSICFRSYEVASRKDSQTSTSVVLNRCPEHFFQVCCQFYFWIISFLKADFLRLIYVLFAKLPFFYLNLVPNILVSSVRPDEKKVENHWYASTRVGGNKQHLSTFFT